jgi:hypothetical protein
MVLALACALEVVWDRLPRRRPFAPLALAGAALVVGTLNRWSPPFRRPDVDPALVVAGLAIVVLSLMPFATGD